MAAGVDAQELSSLAAEAARGAGRLLLDRYGSGRTGEVRAKSTPTDLVSEADLASQRLIRELIAARRPNDGFLGEEGGDDRDQELGASGLRWVVDPLDGTVNFLFGIPQWCVSVAVEDRDGVIAGAIYDPCRDELFTGLRNGPAQLNGRPLEGPPPRELAQAMVATGFYYDAAVRREQARILVELLPRVRDIRRFGAAALDLAWTAAGRYDAYFERGVKRWDVAAGLLICRCVGLAVGDLRPLTDGRGRSIPAGVVVCRPEHLAKLTELAEGGLTTES